MLTRGNFLRLALLVLALGLAFEAWRVWSFYEDVSSSREVLASVREDLSLSSLDMSVESAQERQVAFGQALHDLESARAFVDSDPLVFLGSQLPWVGKNAEGVKHLVYAAEAGTRAGIDATDVILAFNAAGDDPEATSIEEAMQFLETQQPRMARIRTSVDAMLAASARLHPGMIGELETSRRDLQDATARLSSLVEGYEKAYAFLPGVLGYDGNKNYLLLFQNDTETFPSGGLISNYGIATFEEGRLAGIEIEYFVNLFDRWQAQSGGEYVEPPKPLKDHLLRHVSWGLGEAGWYPDFPTTARLATDFVARGGAPATDGTIAIDLKFVSAILEVVGPVYVPGYGVSVTAENLSELTLELTREDSPQPGQSAKVFLSDLASELIRRIFGAPKDQWLDLLNVMDRMGKERHLQISFDDPGLQALSTEYFLDGSIVEHDGDFLMLADTSVLSTKLNLILEPSVKVDLHFGHDDAVTTHLSYKVTNPLPQWSAGRDPDLVHALMIDGTYGSYLRVLTGPAAVLRDVRVQGQPVGASQIVDEVGKQSFARFFVVGSGETRDVDFVYMTPDVVRRDDDRASYSLYLQKQPGTGSTPLQVELMPPVGGEIIDIRLDGESLGPVSTVSTDMSVDRLLEVSFVD